MRRLSLLFSPVTRVPHARNEKGEGDEHVFGEKREPAWLKATVAALPPLSRPQTAAVAAQGVKMRLLHLNDRPIAVRRARSRPSSPPSATSTAIRHSRLGAPNALATQ